MFYRYESEVLLRVTQRIALFLSCLLGPTATPTVNYYEEVERIEKVRTRLVLCPATRMHLLQPNARAQLALPHSSLSGTLHALCIFWIPGSV